MFKIPIKQLIVNSDSQARLLEDDGTTYADGDCTPTGGGFILENFLPLVLGSKMTLLASATRIRAQAGAAAVACVGAATVSDTAGSKGDVFRVVVDSLDLAPTVFQNTIVEKIYQLRQDIAAASAVAQVETITITGTSGTADITLAGGLTKTATFNTNLDTTASDFVSANAAAYAAVGITITSGTATIIFTAATAGVSFTAPAIANATGDLAGTVAHTAANVESGAQKLADEIAAVINLDSNGFVTASVASNVVTLTAVTGGQKVALYSADITLSWAEDTPAALPINTYDALKNKEWARNLDYDRNEWEMPRQGVTYKSYYFEVDWTGVIAGSDVAGQTNQAGRTGFMIYVNPAASTLVTALDYLVGDVNV